MAFLGLLNGSVTFLLPWLGCKRATRMYSVSLCLCICLSQSLSFCPAQFHSLRHPHGLTSAESSAECSMYPAHLSLGPLRLSCHSPYRISCHPPPPTGHPEGWSPALPAVLAQQTQSPSGIHSSELGPLQTAWASENFSVGPHLAGLPSFTEFGKALAQFYRRCEQGSDFQNGFLRQQDRSQKSTIG